MLFSLPGIIWASPNSPHTSRPALKNSSRPLSRKNFFQIILVHSQLCVEKLFYICCHWILFYFASSFHSGMLLGCVGALTKVFPVGFIYIHSLIHPKSASTPFSGIISWDTMKEMPHQAATVIYLPGYLPGTKTLRGLHRQEFWSFLENLVDSTCGVEDWRVPQRGERRTRVHIGSVWDWDSLLRQHCKSWSIPGNEEEL